MHAPTRAAPAPGLPRAIAAHNAQTVKRVSLELGGNAPFIVFDDADLELAASGVVASALRNSGQTCICAGRVFVQDKVGMRARGFGGVFAGLRLSACWHVSVALAWP
jgi:delta 1-pyrroline-5-carboxylate dehydrogenase